MKGDFDMLGDQIKKYRKEKKMSQEELAIPLNVVRQTVSKWENNLSVPDAELLLQNCLGQTNNHVQNPSLQKLLL